MGSVWGAITGAAAVKLIEDQLQTLIPALLGKTGSFEVIAFGVILVLVLKYARGGVWPWIAGLIPSRPRKRDWVHATPLPERQQPARGTPILQATKLRKEFGGLVAVNDISFEVRAGEIVGLIGPNGAGKSTTFHLLSGVITLTSGEILLHGQRVEGMASRDIASRGVARTFQHVKMVPDMTVLENVALGAHLRGHAGGMRSMLRLDRAEERSILRNAEAQLTRVGLADHMFEPAGNLAMGLQRLMEIARALCSDPVLLMLDEPAAGLRHFEKLALAKVLRQLREDGVSILMVEHDMTLMMSVADRIVVMEFGTHLMEGTPAEVQASPAVRAAYLGTEH
jgi:branched-chain amino acid transport system permease protein